MNEVYYIIYSVNVLQKTLCIHCNVRIYRKWNSDLNNYFHNVYTFVYLYAANGKVY